MTILTAKRDRSTSANLRCGHEQGGGRTNHNFGLASTAPGHGRTDLGNFAEAFTHTVHFPVPRNEGAWVMGHAESFPLI
jgi:hypothetical protein